MAHRPRAPVVLTSFHKQGSLDTYLREVRTIRESRMLYPAKESRDDEQAGEEEGASAPTLHVRRVFRTDIMIILLDVLQESLHWHWLVLACRHQPPSLATCSSGAMPTTT